MYLVFSITNSIGWLSFIRFKNKRIKHQDKNKFTLILPVRNEQENILIWLKSINELNYDAQLIEIIIVNDHSTDNTVKLIKNFKSKFNLRLLHLEHTLEGKKNALELAIKESVFNLIITTDADCTYNSEWINSINHFYSIHEPNMIIAPVTMNHNNFFEKLQTLDFISLMGTGLSLSKLKLPVLSNGANLIYEKTAFNNVNGYSESLKTASGDDIFLTMKFDSKGYKILPLPDINALVKTQSSKTIKSFVNQKIRWASKTKIIDSILFKLLGVFIFCFNFLLIINFFLSLIFSSLFEILTLQWCLKFVFDFLFLLLVSSFLKERKLLFVFPIASILYPWYILIVGLMSFKGKFQWKERNFVNGQ